MATGQVTGTFKSLILNNSAVYIMMPLVSQVDDDIVSSRDTSKASSEMQ